jgi:hypothetical protein
LRQYTVISRIACGADIFSNYNSANLKEQFYYEMSIRDILAMATKDGEPLSTKADYKEYFARGTVNVTSVEVDNVKETTPVSLILSPEKEPSRHGVG